LHYEALGTKYCDPCVASIGAFLALDRCRLIEFVATVLPGAHPASHP